MLPFQLSCITSSICRHPSYFKHSGVLRWKHARNLDDWPSTPPPSTPTIPALCYLLRGRRGRRRPGCLDEVITAYQWQRGGRPADLWGDASWVKSGGTVRDGSCRAEREGSAVRAGLLDGGKVQSAYMMRIKVFFTRILCPFQTHFAYCCCCCCWYLSLTEHLNFLLALSVRVLLHCHMAAEKLQYMVQIRPRGMRLFLTSLANPPPPPSPTTHSSLHLFYILHRMWLTHVCFNYTVSVIYREIKERYR